MEKSTIPEAIEKINNSFVIFGDPDAPFWFLGLEEGDKPSDGQSISDCQSIESFVRHVERKTDRYNKAPGKLSLRDLCGTAPGKLAPDEAIFLPNAELLKLGGYRIRYQQTWGVYTKLLYSIWSDGAANVIPWQGNQINDYQHKYLGECEGISHNKKSCLMELFALPCAGRKSSQWLYSPLADKYPELQYLSSGKDYRDHQIAPRLQLLVDSINEYKPEYLFCFGQDCQVAFSSVQLSDIREEDVFTKNGKISVKSGFLNNTLVVFTHHATARDLGDAYWINLGNYVKRRTSRVEKVA